LSFVGDFNRLGKCQDVTETDMETESSGKRTRRSTSDTLAPGPAHPRFSGAELGDKLQSWKEIAGFLGHDERTVMRWERLGMPVHRIPGTKRSRVYASRTEITNWLKEQRDASPSQRALPPPRRLTKWFLATGIPLVLALSVGVFIVKPPRGGRLPADARLSGQALTALDSDGHRLWAYPFERKLNPVLVNPPVQFTWVADLMGDGDREVIAIVPYALGPNQRDGTEFRISCFSSRGKLRWSYTPREIFRFGTHELHGPWQVLDLIVSRQGTKKAVYAAFVHGVWGNSFVAELDPTNGRGTVRFVNTGTIRSLGEIQTSRATYLIVGGFNNEYDSGSSAFIDERKQFAASPHTAGTRHQCTSCPKGDPDGYLVFPRSEGARATGAYESPVAAIKVTGDEVEFSKYETPAGHIDVDAIYLFGFEPRFHPISVRYGSFYDRQHPELERSGQLHHSLEQCPERLHPSAVRMWTPSGRWTDFSFEPSRFDQ
jgi:hypothetical protein